MKIALIGYGNIAKKHLEVFRFLGCDFVASSNRSEAGNAKALAEGGIPKTYTDFVKMAETESPDAILVCASFENIFSISSMLIPLGIPLLIEKPAGTSVDELNELIELKDKHQTPVQVALNRRHYSIFHSAIADMGGIQELTAMSIEWSENPVKVMQAKGYSAEQTAKLVYGNSIHGIDTLLHFAGNTAEDFILTKNIDGNFRCHMQMSGLSQSGKLIHFQSSWDNPVPWRIVMSSKNKRYVFAPLESCLKTEADGTQTTIQPETFDQQFKAGFYLQAKHFIDIVSANKIHHAHDLDSCIPGMVLAEKFYNGLFSSLTKSSS